MPKEFRNAFELISERARRHGALDFGQSGAEFGWPVRMLEVAAKAIQSGAANQYPPSAGLSELRYAVATHYKIHQGLRYTEDEVVVTSGATEALASAIFALIGSGDRVVIFQPAYGAYLPLVRRAGGVPMLVPLHTTTWTPDLSAFEQAIVAGARTVILNSPLNPFGSMLDPATVERFAALCEQYDVQVIADEVWEHTSFERPFSSIVSAPGMADRTVKIGAAGKIFGLLGWKVGWACSSRKHVQGIAQMHQNLTFATAPHLQHAVAFGLIQDPEYFGNHRRLLRGARDRLSAGLVGAGFWVEPCESTHFLIIDLESSDIALSDADFCSLLVTEVGVAAIPVSIFFDGNGPTKYVRFCFAKTDSTIDQAIDRLATARSRMAAGSFR